MVLGLVAVAVAAGRVGVDILDTETIVLAGPVGRMTAAVATWLFGTLRAAQPEVRKAHVVHS